MNPEYLWLAGTLELLTFFVVGPVLGFAIAVAAWRRKPQSFKPNSYGVVCAGSGVTAVLLFACAKWTNVDVRSTQYFLQFACVILSGLLFGLCMGSGFGMFLRLWRWHKTTRLAHHPTEQ